MGNCSWGIQRKISVLLSLIGDLPLILLDEPSSGIDVIARQAICDILHQIREMGRSLLIITHKYLHFYLLLKKKEIINNKMK